MSSGGKNRKSGRIEQDIDLEAVLSFLRMLLCMAAGIAVLALVGMVLMAMAGGELVIYQMTLAVDGILLAGGWFCVRRLRARHEILLEKGRET